MFINQSRDGSSTNNHRSVIERQLRKLCRHIASKHVSGWKIRAESHAMDPPRSSSMLP